MSTAEWNQIFVPNLWNMLIRCKIYYIYTFKSAANIGFVGKRDGKWIKLLKCIFCVMGINGSVILWRFTCGELLKEVRELLVELRSRFNSRNIPCQGIVIDNCCKWKGMLTGIFHNVQVKLDFISHCLTLPAHCQVMYD